MTATDDVEHRVNMTELALVIGTSETTIRKLLERHPEFPVLERGKHGVAYEFDAAAVKAWLEEHREAESAARKARTEEVHQMRLELFGGETVDDSPVLSAAERSKEIEAELRATKLAEARGQLTRTADVERCASQAFLALRNELDTLPETLGRRLGLKRDEVAAIRETVGDALTRCGEALTDTEAYAGRSDIAA